MNALLDTWLMFEREHGCSIDRMVCRPALRNEFVSAARTATGESDEETLLWTLMSLRKRKELSARKKSHSKA